MTRRIQNFASFISLLLAIFFFFAFGASALALDALKNTDPDQYYIVLDLNNQIVTVYEKDMYGEYTRIVRRMLCTTGRTELDPEDPEDQGTPTPRGIWKIGARERFGKFAAFSGEYARYWTQVVGGVYFHSIMFSSRSVHSLKSGPYRSLGKNVSHGCIRLYVEDAKWLYYYACPGTVVNITDKAPKNRALVKKLKSTLSFKQYNKMQKNIYDTKELENKTAWIAKDSADMRTGNGSNDRRIKKLKEGEAVEVLQIGDPWCKVRHGKREGYIKTAYLTFEKGVMQSFAEADIIKSTSYMYEEASAKSKRICKIPSYTTVRVLGEAKGGFVKIYIWGDEGYILESALTKGWGLLEVK